MPAALANSTHPTEAAFSKLVKRIEAEPAYQVALFKLLQFCKNVHTTAEIAAELRSFPEMQTALHSPEILLSWMIEAGGIEQIPSEEREENWQTTAVGGQVLDQNAPMKQLSQLFSQEPLRRDDLVHVLKYCETAKTTGEIEGCLNNSHALSSNSLPVMYFIQTLEKVGGLEWVGKWHTTESGRAILGSLGVGG